MYKVNSINLNMLHLKYSDPIFRKLNKLKSTSTTLITEQEGVNIFSKNHLRKDHFAFG